MKKVTNCSTKCKLEYLPVIPLPPGDNVIKWYMDMIMQIPHADESINSKMLIISWLNQDAYEKMISLMGGFHTILVNLKILFKKYGCLGFKDWLVDAGAIADGSVAQPFEGRHYASSVRLKKKSFEALLRHRMKPESVGTKLDQNMREAIAKLRNNPCPENLACSSLMQSEGTQAKIM